MCIALYYVLLVVTILWCNYACHNTTNRKLRYSWTIAYLVGTTRMSNIVMSFWYILQENTPTHTNESQDILFQRTWLDQRPYKANSSLFDNANMEFKKSSHRKHRQTCSSVSMLNLFCNPKFTKRKYGSTCRSIMQVI